MFCNICRRHGHSGSFSVGNTDFKLETIKAYARSESNKQNQLRFDATRKQCISNETVVTHFEIKH